MGGLQFHNFYRGSYGGHIDSNCYLVSPHGGGDHCCYCGFYQWHQVHTCLRAVHLPLMGSSGGQAPGYLLEPQRPLKWPSTLLLLTQGHWLWGAFRRGRPRNIPKVPPFLLQEVMSSFLPPRAAVAALPGFSRIVGDTSHSSQLAGGMHLSPLWVFLSFISHTDSWCGRIGQLICQCGGEGN